MAPKPTGQVIEKKTKKKSKDGVTEEGVTYALRFRAYGQRRYVTLGTSTEGYTREQAEQELRHTLADLERGIWQPPTAQPEPEIPLERTFHEFASEWLRGIEPELSDKGKKDYRWRLSNHLLPFFHAHPLRSITVAEADRYRQTKVREAQAIREAAAKGRPITESYRTSTGKLRERRVRPMSHGSINKTLTTLGAILDAADEGGLIDRNPVRVNPRKRKLKAPKPSPVWLDRADHIAALLDAADELDRTAPSNKRHVPRRTMVATLCFAGLRLDEMCALRWRHIDLEAKRLHVQDSKTDAGARRDVDLLPALRDALAVWGEHARHGEPDDYVFATSRGGKPSGDNFRSRVFDRAVSLANERRVERGLAPLRDGLTPHKMRHTFCSILFARGLDLPTVMAQLGHAHDKTTLRIYGHVMSRQEGDREALAALVDGADWAPLGTNAAEAAIPA